jgi:uncharacterized protein
MYFEALKNNLYLLRFELGEEVQESILKFAESQNLKGAFFNGIGGVKNVELGYYQKAKKDYKRIFFEQELEMVSLTGNVAKFENRYVVHSHGCFGDEQGRAHAGHIIKAFVAFTVEIILQATDIPLEKKMVEDLGIKAFAFSSHL